MRNGVRRSWDGSSAPVTHPSRWPLADWDPPSPATRHPCGCLSEKGWAGGCGHVGVLLQPLQGAALRTISQPPLCCSLWDLQGMSSISENAGRSRELKSWKSDLGTLFHYLDPVPSTFANWSTQTLCIPCDWVHMRMGLSYFFLFF